MLRNEIGRARLALPTGVAASLAASCAGADEAEARKQIEALPKRGAAEAAFVPRGWSVEQRLEADLDGDKAPDEVLVLLQNERVQTLESGRSGRQEQPSASDSSPASMLES
jgi:hypothetical protein